MAQSMVSLARKNKPINQNPRLKIRMTQTITIQIKDIVYENGKTELAVVTPQQWAGRLRRKGYKKTILTQKEVALLTIKIKTK